MPEDRRKNDSQERRRARWAGPWLGAAIVLQAWVLTRLAALSLASSVALLVFAVVLAILVARSWARLAPSFLRDVVWVTASLGGLGMILGGTLDARLVEPLAPLAHAAHSGHASHAAPAHAGHADHGIASWSGLLMLGFCVPGCALLCEPCARASSTRRFFAHGLCAVGMLLGMVLVGDLLSWPFARIVPPVLASHAAMLLGMVLGTGLAALVVRPGVAGFPGGHVA